MAGRYKATKYGEYQFIAKKINCVKLLEKAHRTPYTKKQAIVLFKLLSERYWNDKNFLLIRWFRPYMEKGFNYGGVIKHKGARKPYVYMHPDQRNKSLKIFGLRKGIIIHEFTHAFVNYHSKKKAGEGHGRKFIKAFEKILMDFKNFS